MVKLYLLLEWGFYSNLCNTLIYWKSQLYFIVANDLFCLDINSTVFLDLPYDTFSCVCWRWSYYWISSHMYYISSLLLHAFFCMLWFCMNGENCFWCGFVITFVTCKAFSHFLILLFMLFFMNCFYLIV